VDWDEIFDDCVTNTTNGGFKYNTPVQLKNGTIKQIRDVNVGDVLVNGEVVYGVVEIIGHINQYKYNLGDVIIEGGSNLGICDSSVKDLMELRNKEITLRDPKLFHLLTNTHTLYIHGLQFFDYT
jgi:hypothetical protein